MSDVPIRTAVVPVSEVLDLRWEVLRPGLPRESAVFPEDDHPATFHIAAYGDGDGTGEADAVLGCATFFPDPLPGATEPAYRFRGMASAPAVRGRGFGAAVLRAGTAEAAARGARLLWCNGRTVARGFYEHHGFAVRGEEFEIEGVGPHYVFVKNVGSAKDTGGAR